MKALELRDTMKPTYLVQRLHKGHGGKVDNPFSFGGGFVNGGLSEEFMKVIRPIFSFDYMGSAEFEFGAVPEALQFIVNEARKGDLEAGVLAVGEEKFPVYFIAPRTYIEEVAKRIKMLFEGSVRTKEHVGLREYFKGSSWSKTPGRPNEYDQQNKGWIELDNGFMFFSDKGMWLDVCDLFDIGEKK